MSRVPPPSPPTSSTSTIRRRRTRFPPSPPLLPPPHTPSPLTKQNMPRSTKFRQVRVTILWLAVLSVLLVTSGLRASCKGAALLTGVRDRWGAQMTKLRATELNAQGNGNGFARNRKMMHADYRRRLTEAMEQGGQEPVKEYVRWLHIPKTGTSFVNTLLRWGCKGVGDDLFVVPRKERPEALRFTLKETFSWDWLFTNETGRVWLRENCGGRLVTTNPNTKEPHYALYMHRALRAWEVSKAAAIFRLPRQRMYSNYLHLSLHYNESQTFREPLAEFVQKPQFWSQQAKLMLGRHYKDKRKITASEAVTAAYMVRKRLKFVGLTEEFELTTRLFHAKFGGVPHRAQFENIRPGIYRYRDRDSRSSAFRYDESQFDGWADPADWIVYSAARRRFWDDVKAMKTTIELDGLGKVVIDKDFDVVL